MINYRIESGPRRNLEKSTFIYETRKTYVWTVPDNQNRVVKIKKQNHLIRFPSLDDTIAEISRIESNHSLLISLLDGKSTPIVLENTYIIYPLPEKSYGYDIEQPRVFGKTLDSLRVKVIGEPSDVLIEIGKIIQAHLTLHKQNKTVDLLGSLWPNDYTKLARVLRPFLPIFFSKNIMVGQLENEGVHAWLVDPGISRLDNSNSKQGRLSKKILIGSYISMLLIKSKVQNII